MSREPQPPAIRATDADREAVVERLRLATADGALTLDEFSERCEVVYATRLRADLAPLTADLPAPPAPLPVVRERRGLTLRRRQRPEKLPRKRAVLKGTKLKGRLTVQAHSAYTATLGSLNLDLRQAILPAGDIEVHVRVWCGAADITVPEGYHVVVDDDTVASSCECDLRKPRPGADAPTIHVRASGLFGSVNVRDTTSLGERIAEKVKATVESSIERKWGIHPPPPPPPPSH